MAAVAGSQVVRPIATTGSQNVEELMQKLDKLLEQYLDLLDQYQEAQKQLSTRLSAGYMSLAKANFANNAGCRYGQDYYDERMQAHRVVDISSVSGDGREEVLQFKCTQTPNLEGSERRTEPKEDNGHLALSDKESTVTNDPIRWFGVLVPPSLRSAQSSFIAVVQDSVPNLLNLQQEMRGLEIEIGRTRKSIKKLEKV